MDMAQTIQSLWVYATAGFEYLQASLAGADPQYLLLGLGMLVWLQLGRIARALKDSKGLPRNLPQRLEQLQSEVRSMGRELEEARLFSTAKRRPPSTEEALAVYRGAPHA